MGEMEWTTALKALGEENRLRLLRLLMQHEHSVTELSVALGLTTYNTSKHLRILKEAGLISMRKEAQQRMYDIATAMQKKLKKNGNVLDLGCCQFQFDKLPA